jgi:quercetin dioxygenase-like cupin family protein
LLRLTAHGGFSILCATNRTMPEKTAKRRTKTPAGAPSALAADLKAMIEFARDGIVSKTITQGPWGKVVLFCMARGQALSEHTASVPAVVHVLSGQGTIKLGSEEHRASPGSWFFMPAKLVHAVHADRNLVFLLTMFRPR